LLQSNGGFSCAPALDRTGQCVSKDTQRCAFVRLLLHPGQRLWSGFVPSQAQRGRFSKGPLAVRVPTLVPRSAPALAPGCFRTLDEATIRSASLHTWDASDLVHGVEQDQTKDCANARHGVSEGKGLGLVLLRRVEQKECEVAAPLLSIGEQSEGDLKSLLASRGVKPRGATCTMGCISDCLADFWQVILRMGLWDMRQECRAFAPEVGAASQPSTGRAPLGRIDRGCWQQPAAAQGGNLLRVDVVIFGLAAVQGFHRERRAQHQGHACWSAEVGKPIPGEETCNGHDQAVAGGSNGLEERLRSGLPIAVYKPRALLTHDADVHAAGM
jgi:hypothetical protein